MKTPVELTAKLRDEIVEIREAKQLYLHGCKKQMAAQREAKNISNQAAPLPFSEVS
jgi:hypothetical protein